MNHWLVAPLILPAITAAVVLLWLRYRLTAARFLSLGICAVLGFKGSVWEQVPASQSSLGNAGCNLTPAKDAFVVRQGRTTRKTDP